MYDQDFEAQDEKEPNEQETKDALHILLENSKAKPILQAIINDGEIQVSYFYEIYERIQQYIDSGFRQSSQKEIADLQNVLKLMQRSLRRYKDLMEWSPWYHLLIGTTYFGQAVFKTERYISAISELEKAETHFERGIAGLTGINSKDKTVFYLLLLNKAKYFCTYIMEDKQRFNTCLLRALELVKQIELSLKNSIDDTHSIIYAEACMTELRILRILASWNSPSKRYKLSDTHKIPVLQSEYVEKCTEMSFEVDPKYAQQIALNLCLYYRETILFPQSAEGEIQLKKALEAAWINRNGQPFTVEELCKAIEEGISQNFKENQDLKNNIAACLKKLGKYEGSSKMFKHLLPETSNDQNCNNYADYQQAKFLFAMHELDEGYILDKLNKNSLFYENGQKKNDLLMNKQEMRSDLSKFSRQWLFLYARYLQRYGQHAQAQRIFRFLYVGHPIVWNSLEMKAAYLDADSYMLQEQFSKALEILNHLHDSLSKIAEDALEIRTEIDRGWCMLRLYQFEKAKDVYFNLLNSIQSVPIHYVNFDNPGAPKWDEIDEVHQARILNNLYLCSLYSSANATKQIKTRIKSFYSSNEYDCKSNPAFYYAKNWINLLDSVFITHNEKNQPESGCNNTAEINLEKWNEYLRCNTTNNLAFRYYLLFLCKHSDNQQCLNALKNYLLYATTPIDLHVYIEVAKAIQKADRMGPAFCSLFCHAKLTQTGINQSFMSLMENESFCHIDLVKRCNILTQILMVYEIIIQIKKLCAIPYSKVADEKLKFYKYTGLNSLKKYLSADEEHPTRLQISNIVHMNDLLEGNAFNTLFEGMECPALDGYIGNYRHMSSEETLPTFQSDVFTGSFTDRSDNFGMWNGYAGESTGCLVEIDSSFFDYAATEAENSDIWGEDLGENTLYRVLYVKREGTTYKIVNRPDIGDELQKLLGYLCDNMEILDSLIRSSDESHAKNTSQPQEVLRNFIADRLNEIRYLFKSADYAYEEEYRILHCSQSPQIDMNGRDGLPYIYIDVDRELKINAVQLGSKVDLQKFMVISAWAKNCKGMPKVTWSDENRQRPNR